MRSMARHSDSPTMRIKFIKAMPYESQSSADMVCSIGSRGYRYIGSHTARIAVMVYTIIDKIPIMSSIFIVYGVCALLYAAPLLNIPGEECFLDAPVCS